MFRYIEGKGIFELQDLVWLYKPKTIEALIFRYIVYQQLLIVDYTVRGLIGEEKLVLPTLTPILDKPLAPIIKPKYYPSRHNFARYC